MFTKKSQTPKNTHHKPVFCLFGNRATIAPSIKHPLIMVVLIAASTIPIAGCSFGQSKNKPAQDKYAQEAPGVFTDQWDENTKLNIPDGDESTQWSIILVTLPNERLAPQVLSSVQTKYGLSNAYIDSRKGTSVIAYGNYPGPNDRNALLDLDRVREIQSDQSRPFAGAYLAPPSAEKLAGANSEYDLRTVKKRFGPTALYTLQLGVYGTMDRSTPTPSQIKEFRKTAEQAVQKLRSEGERAFYYHGPVNSMVTVGVFGERDFDSSTTPPIESSRLKELRKRYPHNYLNGQGIKETVNSSMGQRVTRLQASSLVAIPEK